MPIWVKCIFMLWVSFVVMHCFAIIWADEIRKRCRLVKLGISNLPLYMVIYALAFVLCILSIIPFAIWVIFLR